MKRRSECTCAWTRVAPPPADVPLMTHREPTCPQHGDDTDWWERTRKAAESLKYGTAPIGSKGRS